MIDRRMQTRVDPTRFRIAFLAFFEVARGGCILVGETHFVDEQPVGESSASTKRTNRITSTSSSLSRSAGPGRS